MQPHSLNRRLFVRAASVALTGFVVSCGESDSPQSTVISPGSASGQNDWNELKRNLSLSSRLVLPNETYFKTVAPGVNSRFDDIVPQAVVRCATTEDVSTAVKHARSANIDLTARSGGHSYGGFSNGTGLIVDVGPMNSVELQGTTAVVGAGARLASIYDALSSKGVCIPSGSCGSVGIAGITMGGGIGLLDRTYGLTCDTLLAAEVVLADGRIVTASAEENSDLFWALRGGGGGNFGIVTKFHFQTHPTQNLTRFASQFAFQDCLAVLGAWQDWVTTLPDSIWTNAVFWHEGGAESDLKLNIGGCCIGESDAFMPHWNRFLSQAAVSPLADSVSIETKSYAGVILGDCRGAAASVCARPSHYGMGASSDFFNKVIPEAGLKALLNAIANRQTSGKPAGILFDSAAGAIARIPANATAFVHRKALLSAQYIATYDPTTPAATIDDGNAWAHGMRSVMAPWSTGGAYANYIDTLLSNWQTAYYGSNLTSLVACKAKFDPDNVFNFPQSIPVSL
jgi:FAD/FMN-containing dehydrogenase